MKIPEFCQAQGRVLAGQTDPEMAGHGFTAVEAFAHIARVVTPFLHS